MKVTIRKLIFSLCCFLILCVGNIDHFAFSAYPESNLNDSQVRNSKNVVLAFENEEALEQRIKKLPVKSDNKQEEFHSSETKVERKDKRSLPFDKTADKKKIYDVPKVVYRPPYPTLGKYSIPGICKSIHKSNAPKVVLKSGEQLINAWERLSEKTSTGGIIEIPWNVNTVQCDGIRLNGRLTTRLPTLTLKGIPGPNGEQPRFYCRSDKFKGGTIPFGAGPWLTFMNAFGKSPTVVVENIHVDGYSSFIKAGYSGKVIVRNSYAHHGKQSGIGNAGTSRLFGTKKFLKPQRFELEFCGSELAFYGQGNAMHGFYMHTALGGAGDNLDLIKLGGNSSYQKITVVDSIIHDTNWSSGFKSVANENILVNNYFAETLETDPSYNTNGKRSQMLIDVIACAQNKIEGNKIEFNSGGIVLGIRNRKMPDRGCAVPVMWTPLPKLVVHQDGRKEKVYVPEKVEGPWHSDTWWSDLEGKKFFETLVEGNTFIAKEGKNAEKAEVIASFGTYPNYQSGFGSPACWLPTPKTWYERSTVRVRNNTYVNIRPEQNYVKKLIQNDYKGKCPTAFTVDPDPNVIGDEYVPGPGPSSDLFEIGDNEVYK